MNVMTRGDLKPDLEITISDAADAANFSTLTANACVIRGEMDGVLVFEDTADTITPAQDNKSAVLKRAWDPGDTDTVGRLWVTVDVTWPDGDQQTFPAHEALRVDIRRAAGDA